MQHMVRNTVYVKEPHKVLISPTHQISHVSTPDRTNTAYNEMVTFQNLLTSTKYLHCCMEFHKHLAL